ncbi:MAG: family 1 encapsulin nanocompartment shell protein [Bacteroidales bacterium]
MNILKKTLAPITDRAWKEIELQSDRVVREYLTTRQIIDIDGPNGIEMGAVSTGRLVIPPNQSKNGINYGIREVVPLVEVRKPFTLDLWELDNASRNADDLDLENLEEAARQIAAFEDDCLYHGFDGTHFPGMVKSMEGKPVKISLNAGDFIQTIVEQLAELRKRAVEGPYALVVPDQVWSKLVSLSSGYPLHRQMKEILEGPIILHHSNKEIFLVSKRGGDIELILGQDISLGYEGHDTEKVKLFFTESFTHRILGPEAFRVIQPA